MCFYSDIVYLVCISIVILAYMDFSVCVSVGDPNCHKFFVCVFTCCLRADVHKLRVFSGDTIGSPFDLFFLLHLVQCFTSY